MSGIDTIQKILNREDPGRFAYAPNYWQWYTHRINSKNIPEDLSSCATQLDVIKESELDVFSRNVYADPYDYWFGGLSDRTFRKGNAEKSVETKGKDRIITWTYHLPGGDLTERLRYIHEESTLVQEKFLIDDPDSQMDLFREFLENSSWTFQPERYRDIQKKCGDSGLPVAGEFFSPLKMLHIYLGPVETTYLLADREEEIKPLLALHENAQLDLLKQMTDHGVQAVMSMDNLDTMFHPPHYVEEYSASFYEEASSLCHTKDSCFFIHACGQQKANLKLISSLGVDGLEGVAYPPLGDVELEEAMELAGSDFIISGGISAAETTVFKTKDEVYAYLENLFVRMKPYRNRFILSASCNTAIETPWETLKFFHEAWRDLGC